MYCNITDLELSHHVRLIEFVLYGLIFLFGGLFNVLALWVFCKMKKWTETRVYAINLVFADCFVICTLPFMAYFLWTKSPRSELCRFVEAMYLINMAMSSYTIAFISIDRYIAIKYPLKARTFRSPSKAALLCGLLWVLVITGVSLECQRRSAALCFENDTATPGLSLSLMFILPFVILTFCSVVVIRNLKSHLNTNPSDKKLIQRAIHIIYANLIAFLICFLPAYMGILAGFIIESVGAPCSLLQVMKNVSSVTRCIATSNCCMDSICYYLMTKEFHESLLQPKSSTERNRSNLTFADTRLLNVGGGAGSPRKLTTL